MIVRRRRTTQGLVHTFADLMGADCPVALRAYDGSQAGLLDPAATLDIRSRTAVRRVLAAPNELGLARAYAAGDIEVDGDIYAVLQLRARCKEAMRRPRGWSAVVRLVAGTGGGAVARRSRPGGSPGARTSAQPVAGCFGDLAPLRRLRRLLPHVPRTDDDVPCGLWERASVGLDAAQEARYELICRKLALAPGMRLRDVSAGGAGWSCTLPVITECE